MMSDPGWIALDKKHRQVRALSADDLRQRAAELLDLDTWPGDAQVILRIIEELHPEIIYLDHNGDYVVTFQQGWTKWAGSDFRDTVLRAFVLISARLEILNSGS